MRLRAIWVTLLIFSSAQLLAGQAPDGTITHTSGGAPDANGPNIFELLRERMPKKHLKGDSLPLDENKHPYIPLNPDGEGNVPKSQAVLCPVCKQPLYKHDLPGFECIPLDPNTGEPRKLLKISLQSTRCPVCQCEFKSALRENVNGKGGIDRDFCIHSIGNYTVNSNVFMCPECGYAAIIEAFNTGAKPLDESVKTYVRSTITDPMRKRMMDVAGIIPDKATEELLKFSGYIDQTQIPDWIKYDNAVKIYEHTKAPRGFMATLYRDAAHACRREVYSEISVPGLKGSLPESLGKSIRRINRYLQDQCFKVRQAQGISVLDPTVMETDPGVLAQAASEVVRLAEEAYNRIAQAAENNDANAAQTERFFTTGDMYVLQIRYAGILDRLGKLDEADKALRRANSFIPERVEGIHNSPQTPGIEELYANQLRLLHGVVEDRLMCLQKEKEYLFNAAKANMSAILVKEVKFVDDTPPEAESTGGTVTLDGAPASYLLGELFRRSGESAAAIAWFDAAGRILKHRLALLDKAEQQNPASGSPDANAANKAITEKRARFLTLQGWISEQRALVKPTQVPLDEHVTDAINRVLQSCGISGGADTKVDAGPKDTAVAAPVPTPRIAEPKAAKGSMTRDQLFKMYYAALMEYRKAKGQNPPALTDLVKGGFISAADAHLDDKGKLFCPETGEKLLYFDKWEKDDATAAVLLPISATTNTKTLYANGEIRERGKK
jgi:tetratricopeptide (TPR) repeat protein